MAISFASKSVKTVCCEASGMLRVNKSPSDTVIASARKRESQKDKKSLAGISRMRQSLAFYCRRQTKPLITSSDSIRISDIGKRPLSKTGIEFKMFMRKANKAER